jgi:hypothetical protein
VEERDRDLYQCTPAFARRDSGKTIKNKPVTVVSVTAKVRTRQFNLQTSVTCESAPNVNGDVL